MVERSRVDPVAIVARIKRGPVDKDDAVEAEVALDTLDFLDAECRETGCDPGPTAHLVVLDLAAALIAFGAVRNVDELGSLAAQRSSGAGARTREGGREQQGSVQRRAGVLVPVDASGGELALRARFQRRTLL